MSGIGEAHYKPQDGYSPTAAFKRLPPNGSIATVEIVLLGTHGNGSVCIQWPGGGNDFIPTPNVANLDWQPPPWKPAKGQLALWGTLTVTVLDFGAKMALVRHFDQDQTEDIAPLRDLLPVLAKGGEA